MPDLLTHVLAAYVLFAVVGWRVDRFPDRYVSVAMVGAALPDLSKARWVLAEGPKVPGVEIPFSWLALHRLGPLVAMAVVGAFLFERGARRWAFGLLVSGSGLHLFMDALITRANGLSPPYLYPVTWWRPPTGGLYVSSHVWPSIAAMLLAGVVWYARRSSGGVVGIGPDRDRDGGAEQSDATR